LTEQLRVSANGIENRAIEQFMEVSTHYFSGREGDLHLKPLEGTNS
jgi:hypothetical protein